MRAYAATCELGEPRGALDELNDERPGILDELDDSTRWRILDDERSPCRAYLDGLQAVPCLAPGSTSAAHDEANPLQLDGRHPA